MSRCEIRSTVKVSKRESESENSNKEMNKCWGEKGGGKTILASKYRAAKAGHISAKGIGGGWFGEFAGLEPPTIGWFAPQKPGSKSWTQSAKGYWGAE